MKKKTQSKLINIFILKNCQRVNLSTIKQLNPVYKPYLSYPTIESSQKVNLSFIQQWYSVQVSTSQLFNNRNQSTSQLFNNDIQPTFLLLHIKKSVNKSSFEQINNVIQSVSQLHNYSTIKTSQHVSLSTIQQ